MKATGRLQLLTGGERLHRHAREQQLEPGQARRAGQARRVAAQRVGARRRRGLLLPGAQRALAVRCHQQREQHGLELARALDPRQASAASRWRSGEGAGARTSAAIGTAVASGTGVSAWAGASSMGVSSCRR